MKRTRVIGAAVVGLCGLAVIPARAQFGFGETAVLVEILGQVQEEVNQARAIYQGVTKHKERSDASGQLRPPPADMDVISGHMPYESVGASNGVGLGRTAAHQFYASSNKRSLCPVLLRATECGRHGTRVNQLGIQVMDLQQRSDALKRLAAIHRLVSRQSAARRGLGLCLVFARGAPAMSNARWLLFW
jgi:hypothetical protein